MITQNMYHNKFKFHKRMSPKLELLVHHMLLTSPEPLTNTKLNYLFYFAQQFGYVVNGENLIEDQFLANKQDIFIQPIREWFSIYGDHPIAQRTYIYPYIYPITYFLKDQRYLVAEPVPFIHPINVDNFKYSIERWY